MSSDRSSSASSRGRKRQRKDRHKMKKRSFCSCCHDDFENSPHRKHRISVVHKQKHARSYPDVEISERRRRSRETYFRSKSREVRDMNYHYEKSGEYLNHGKLRKALNCINIAMNLCKEKGKILSEIYSRRGIIYYELEKPRCSFQAFLDWEHAYILDPDNMEARKKMSKVLFMGANNFYRMKQYDKAVKPLEYARELDSRNGEAYVLLKVIKKKMQEKKTETTSNVTAKKAAINKRTPETLSHTRSERNQAVLDNVTRLNKLTAEALEADNYTQALIHIKWAIHLYDEDDVLDDHVVRKLSVLKQELMSMTSTAQVEKGTKLP